MAIKGADALEDITLLRVTASEFLPPFPEIAAQLTGSEWLQNLPGTGQDKKTLTVYCNFCHEYQQIFRNRYDEAGWSKIIFRMTHGAGSPQVSFCYFSPHGPAGAQLFQRSSAAERRTL